MEEAFVVIRGKDVVLPKEGDMIILKRQGLRNREASNGAIKEHDNETNVDYVVVR